MGRLSVLVWGEVNGKEFGEYVDLTPHHATCLLERLEAALADYQPMPLEKRAAVHAAGLRELAGAQRFERMLPR